MVWAVVAGAALVLLAVVFLWGLLHLRHSIRVVEQAIREVTPEQVPALRDECVRVFREAFGDGLDVGDYEAAAEMLSARLDDPESLKRAFAREDRYWHFVLPVGAFIGELFRLHLNGTWRPAPEDIGGLEIAVPVRDDVAQTFPFHKVIKHVTTGDPGDVYAYLLSARELDKVSEGLEDGSVPPD